MPVPENTPGLEADRIVFGPADQPIPYTLTPKAEEAALAAEAEAEWAEPEWDCFDAAAYMGRLEAGLEPEAEP